jgi:hypothetical protein
MINTNRYYCTPPSVLMPNTTVCSGPGFGQWCESVVLSAAGGLHSLLDRYCVHVAGKMGSPMGSSNIQDFVI